ncbi:E3 ubiquitin-protein ligase TRIM21-like [Micropterus salmoides]|uniref:E3 ubiquitin-protein ligase TRIM21-like n=1 Tax=Micropterus salmoides TaxID=27706 RepID=UPI0018EA4447|nr:E3 ubiquitin-protein ligase TRIM21-like [Micropterus salmoides]
MASASSLMAVENFLCSICLDVFTKPASIPCGHNFCLKCITDYWDTNNIVFQCPLCKEEFCSKPMLRVNTFIAQMAAKVKTHAQEKSCETPEQAGNGNVLCDICTGAKLTALKSCLVCFMSYCETHLEPHQRISALKKHKLIHPVENLESRICKKHDEPLELFCRVDQMFLCGSCKDRDHKTHKIVSLEEEAQMRRAQLETEMKSSDQMIQARQQKIQEIQHSVEASKNNARKALSYSTHVMAAVVDYIKKSQAELTEVVQTKQKLIETETEGFIKELEEEITKIKQNNLQLNQVSLTNDTFIFLENLLSLTITPPQVKDWSGEKIHSEQFTVQGALTKLETTVMTEIRTLCDPNLKEMQQHAVDVSLDPDTANPFLNVSKDGKQVTHGDRKRNLPDKPERFDNVLNVLAKEGFSSGKFYYEVQVKGKTQWDLGVANQSINRKGDIRLSPKNGYWTIWLRKGKEFTANAGPAIYLHVREMPQKVGVFVDYEGGQVSFYDVDSRACIFSFTGCNFTEKLFPFFSPCSNDGGNNSAPLIITPVYNS